MLLGCDDRLHASVGGPAFNGGIGADRAVRSETCRFQTPGIDTRLDEVGHHRFCTALGKIILAALRPDQLDRYLDRVELKSLTAKTITNPQRLRRELQEIRRAGIAFDDGEFDNEVRCAAMPIHDSE